MSRITEILKQKKLQGFNWDDLSDHLPITSAGLRAAFSRGSVSDHYLEVLEKVLKIKTEERKPVMHREVNEESSSGLYKSIERIVNEIICKEVEPIKNDINQIRQDLNLLFLDQLDDVENSLKNRKDEGSSRKTS